MRELLTPMFGDWGATVLQFVITAIVILALIAVVYWLVRRYSAGALGRIGRGRVPRLAIMDAMAVDGRRKLVLVRRDNVEHLILIGGPSDVVVEQAIVRPRRPATKPEGATAESPQPGEAPRPAVENPPIPFPQVRTQPAAQTAAVNGAQHSERTFSFRRQAPVTPPPVAQAGPATAAVARHHAEEAQTPTPARFVDVQKPTRIEQAASPAAVPQSAPPEPLFPDLPLPADLPLPREEPAHADGNGVDTGHTPRSDAAENRPVPATPSPYARPPRIPDDDTASKVNDLEREMARLLGEITQKQPS